MLSNKSKYDQYRQQYPFFVYQSYEYKINEGDDLLVTFSFNISDKLFLSTNLKIVARSFNYFEQLSKSQCDNLIFHIGMIELISYWKTTCSPKVYIEPHCLSNEQIQWWKKLYFYGLGEFFHQNHIDDVTVENFMNIYTNTERVLHAESYRLNDGVIVPIGGGKDSIITIELLKNYSKTRIPLIINPRQASLETSRVAGFPRDTIIEIQRQLDPQILQLNRQGFLNGHTPFSGMLAFVTLLASAGTKLKHIALSNESSANQPTIKFSSINHQYSKSIEFERDFRYYVNQYISSDFNYFSFLRPLNELTIAKLFANQHKYFPVFKSCNVGSKQDIWCCKCSKCLFTFIILSPFIPPNELEEIFGENLLNKSTLKFEYEQLIGLKDDKPFECVGTQTEVQVALKKALAFYPDRCPYFIENFKNTELFKLSLIDLEQDFLEEHFLTTDFEQLLKHALHRNI